MFFIYCNKKKPQTATLGKNKKQKVEFFFFNEGKIQDSVKVKSIYRCVRSSILIKFGHICY